MSEQEGASPNGPSPASSADSPALTRGFLFCDLRDYTAFVEAHGDQAAAELLGDYRAIVRDALGATGGGEIRTEGDSFYIVFSSVGAAVRCGLAIVAEAGRASAARADRPIRVGVGVHAGESVAEGEGFVGSAVNIAARICALAAPGEVLVSDTVRSLVRTSLPLTFRSRGRPKLKGIAEPIELFAVTPAVETTAVRQAPAARPSRRRLIVVGLGALIVIALAGPLGASVLLRPSEAGNPSPSPAGSAGSSAAAGASPASASAVDLATLPGRMAFMSYQDIGSTRHQIQVAKPDGSDPVQLSGLLTDVQAYSASADGTRLVWTTWYELLTAPVDGSAAPASWPNDKTWKAERFDNTVPLGPFEIDGWLPTGDLVLHKYGSSSHRILAADGLSVEPVATLGDTRFALSPDGLTIAHRVLAGTGGGNIWASSLREQTEMVDLQVTQGVDASEPAWSHSGTRIALAGHIPGGASNGIWVVDARGAGLTQLTDGSDDREPTWSPADDWIVFDRTTDGVRRLWVVRPDGSGLTELPIGANGEQIDAPNWLADAP